MSPSPKSSLLVFLFNEISSDLRTSIIKRPLPLKVHRLLVPVRDLQVPRRSRLTEGILGKNIICHKAGI